MIRVRMEVGPNRHRRSARLFAEHVSSSLLRDFRRKPSRSSTDWTRLVDEKRDRSLSSLSLSRISNISSSIFSCALSFRSRTDSLHRLPSPPPSSILFISFRMTFTTLYSISNAIRFINYQTQVIYNFRNRKSFSSYQVLFSAPFSIKPSLKPSFSPSLIPQYSCYYSSNSPQLPTTTNKRVESRKY